MPVVHEFESGWTVSIIPDPKWDGRFEVGVLKNDFFTNPGKEEAEYFGFTGGIANGLTKGEVHQIVRDVATYTENTKSHPDYEQDWV